MHDPRRILKARALALIAAGVAVAGLTGAPAASAADPADVGITMTAHPQWNGAGFLGAGGWVTYSLAVSNHSAATSAANVAVTDAVPAGVQYVSSSYGCAFAGGVVSCPLGTLAPGAVVNLEIVGHLSNYSFHGTITNTAKVSSSTSDPNPSNNSASYLSYVYNSSLDPELYTEHHVYVEHIEQQVDFEPGQTRTTTLHCSGTGQVIDGDLRVDAVDQGTGNLRSVRVDAAQATAAGDFEITATNTAAGRVQAKAFGVCLPRQVDPGPDGHTHSINLGTPQSTTVSAASGSRYDVTIPCGPGQVAVAPGYSFGGGATGELVRSESGAESSPGWSFSFDVGSPGAVTASVRCLDRYVSVTNGHFHELLLSHPDTIVNVPANSTGTYTVSCNDEAKGIVATYDLPTGVHLLGSEPDAKNRAFKLVNETGSPQAVRLDLVCLGDRTGIDPPPQLPETNVGSNAVAAASGATVRVALRCAPGGCSGNVVVSAPKSVARGSSSILGSARFAAWSGGRTSAVVTVARPYRLAIRRGELRSLIATAAGIDGAGARRERLRVVRAG